MRLALYAHYSSTNGVALYVTYYLRKLRELGFEICFISNSPIPQRKQAELKSICSKIIERENSGYDFSMWQAGLAAYDVAALDELLLTNSSIVGPLQPLEPLWADARVSDADFWGMTDNDDFALHLQTYFVVLRAQVLRSSGFHQFWQSILPFKDKEQLVYSYEVGLTRWLVEHGFTWKALYPQEQLQTLHARRRSLAKRVAGQVFDWGPPRNTTMLVPDLLIESGMPFLKVGLLAPGGDKSYQVSAEVALGLLDKSSLPRDVVEELRGG